MLSETRETRAAARLPPSVTRVVICVYRALCLTDQEKRETTRSLNPFCQQVDDWMLLKITEKMIRENAFEQKKKTQVKFNPGLSANRPSINWALTASWISSR